MQTVQKSGQPESTGSATRPESSPTTDRSSKQLEMFNPRTLKRLVVCDPGDSRDGAASKRRRSGGASREGH